jgi:hypothetical protein
MLKARSVSLALVAALIVAMVTSAMAQDKHTATGTWKWTQQGRQGGNPTEWSAKLKQEGEKLTGVVIGTFQGTPRETAISDGTIKDGEIKFNVVREAQDGTKRTTTYAGKIDGDTLKGTMERERQGEKVSTPWEAKRAKDEPAK